LHPQRVSTASLVPDIIQNFDLAGREIVWQIGSLPDIHSDAFLTRRVFESVLANALKYSRSRSPAVISVAGTALESSVVFCVRDNGVGFDPRYASRLFTLFHRLHPQVEFDGLAVSLALCRLIVQRHGGRIWAEAALGAGAAFYFDFPAPNGI
jgi:light-regulated signal transduction histidine kinase (bacteriophytochrome)